MPADDKQCPVCQRAFGAGVLYCPVDGTSLIARRGSPSASRVGRTSPGPTHPPETASPTTSATTTPIATPLSVGAAAGATSATRSKVRPGTIVQSADPYIGRKILDQIVIDCLLGEGSMARVYKAFQAGVDRDVAVKILHRELSANPEIVERFHREARLASRIDHPNVVRILMTAQLATESTKQGGELVLVMEYIEGESVLSLLQSAGALPLGRALHIILQVCDAVGEAHSRGIVHRDIKPENILVLRRGDDPDFVKVVDFGLARLSSKDATYATRAGAVFGSPRYISPEGAQGLPVGPAADVYSIATVLFQCLAGRTPFDADSPVGLLLAHANETAPRLSDVAPEAGIPVSIVSVVARNLSKRPEDRDANAGAFARSLIEAASAAGALSELPPVRAPWLSSRASASTGISMDTRPMALSPELAAQLDPEAARRGHTIIADDDDLEPDEAVFPYPPPPAAMPKLPAQPAQPTAPTRVDPTLCDEVIAVPAARTTAHASSTLVPAGASDASAALAARDTSTPRPDAPRYDALATSMPTRVPGIDAPSLEAQSIAASARVTPSVAAKALSVSVAAPTAPHPLVAIPPSTPGGPHAYVASTASSVSAASAFEPPLGDVAHSPTYGMHGALREASPDALRGASVSAATRTIPPDELPPARLSLPGESLGDASHTPIPIASPSQRVSSSYPSLAAAPVAPASRSDLTTAPGASLPSTYPDADFRPESPWVRWKGVAIVTACFIVGAGAASIGAARYGMLSAAQQISPADALLADIATAETRNEWGDAELRPEGTSVRDLIQRGRSEFPEDPRFIEAQQRAARSVLSRCEAARRDGRNDQALALAKLALAIQPDDSEAFRHVRELSNLGLPPTTSVPVERPKPPPGTRPPGGLATSTVPPSTSPTTVPTPSSTASPKPTGTHGDPASQRPTDGGTWL